MQEDSKKNTQVPPITELSATERDESIARITAELLQACDATPKAVKKEKAAPAAAQPKAEMTAKADAAPKKNAVLEKEISSATPDKSVEVSQAIAQSLLETDEGVRPFRQGDEKFKNFFTTTAVVLPKEMQSDVLEQQPTPAAKAEKQSVFTRMQGLFARKPFAAEEDDEDEEDDIFFPEEVALERAFPRRPAAAPKAAQAPVDETVQFDLALTQEEAASAPKPTVQKADDFKGKVRFVQPEPIVLMPEPAQPTEMPAPEAKAEPIIKAEPAAQEELVVKAEPVVNMFDPLPELPVKKVAQANAPDADDLPTSTAEAAFEDLSAEAAFLLEECEVQTTRKKTVFTLAQVKVQGWKDSVQSKFDGMKEQRVAAKAAKQAVEDAAVEDSAEESVRVLSQEEADAARTAADARFVDAVQTETADMFFADIADTRVDELVLDDDTTDAPAIVLDPVLTSVQTAFAARGGRAAVPAVSLLPELDSVFSVEDAPEAFVAEPVMELLAEEPAQEAAEEPLQEVAEEPAQEAAEEPVQEVAEEPVQEVAEEPVQEVAEEPVQEVAEEPAQEIAEEPVIAAVTPAEQALDLTLPRGVCLFDQAADEAAAEEQVGEITFVGAPAPSALESDPFVQDVRTPEDVTLDWMPDAPIPAAPAPAEMPLLDDTLLADIAEEAEAAAQDTPPSQPFEDSPKAERSQEPLPEDPEGIQFGLSGMRVKLLVRTFTTAVFATGLFLLGLMGQGVIPAVAAIDPTSAAVPFLLVNLLLLLAAAGVSYPVFIEGVMGLWRKPSPDTLPAIATIAALLQLLLCLTLVDSYDATSITLFSALAGISLFADALGSLVMAQVTQANFNLASAGVPHYLAYRVQGKDAQRTLTRGLEVDSPALLVSRPVQQMEGFLEKSFSPRASDRRAQWAAYGLLGGAMLAYLIALLKGDGSLGAISCFAGVLCIGAPFSATLLAALPSVFLQRSAAKVGAVVPGWQSIAALGDINVLAVESSDLFPPLCAQLHGIKTFQKERVDLAILYATSMLMQGGDTLQNLFSGMIDNKPEMLYPVKDLVHRKGLGFVGWCENYRVILGTRAMMQSEGVPLPALDYENRYSKDGKRQILYLSVSGQLYAMFIIGYRGEKSIARALRTLRKAHIRLLVNCTDPTLTARRIEEIYRLPAGFITLLSEDQAAVMQGATGYRPRAEGCLLHLGNFASLVGGLRAASGAAGAEQAASAIQLVWAAFSILLCLFLCITGGLMQVALVAILLYQLAWSVLNLGVVFTKKFE